MHFKITDKPLIEDNPELATFLPLVAITDRQLRYVLFAFDYESPFRKFPREQWKERAALHVGYKLEKDGRRLDKNGRDTVSMKSEALANAVVCFMGLQYDEDKELLQAYSEQLRQYTELLKKTDKDDKEEERALKVMEKMPALKAKKEELKAAIDTFAYQLEGEMEEIENISTLDRVNIEQQS